MLACCAAVADDTLTYASYCRLVPRYDLRPALSHQSPTAHQPCSNSETPNPLPSQLPCCKVAAVVGGKFPETESATGYATSDGAPGAASSPSRLQRLLSILAAHRCWLLTVCVPSGSFLDTLLRACAAVQDVLGHSLRGLGRRRHAVVPQIQ